MNIVVLAGGFSTERAVSISSGVEICKALRKSGHNAVMLDLFLGAPNINTIEDFYEQQSITLESSILEEIPDLDELKKIRVHSEDGLFGVNVIDICKKADVVFMALHGAEGENGKVQGAFDLLNIKYTGTGYEGSLLAMDKALSKEFMKAHNIPTPSWKVLHKNENYNILDSLVVMPVVIKPLAEGSSIGISIVEEKNELETALDLAFRYGDKVLIEQYVKGREFSVGILDDKVLPPIEILAQEIFFDYKSKYQLNGAIEICPANISDQETEIIQKRALEVHKLLRLGNYSRIDFIQGEDREFYCLEANTLPGMTPTSLLPKEAKAIGISYEEVCAAIVNSAVR